MNRDLDLSSLRAGELIALVNELRQQLAERDQEIERPLRLLPIETETALAGEGAPAASAEPAPGSVEDLLDQLERTYPLSKADC